MKTALMHKPVYALLLAANELQALPEYTGNAGAPGTLFAANESAFDSAHYNEPLTNYVVGGWDQDPLMQLLEFFAPQVVVGRRFHYKTLNHVDEFWRDEGDEDIRPINGKFRETQTSVRSEVEAKTANKGFVFYIDKDELKADPGKLMRELKKVRNRLWRNELRRTLALIDAAATEVTPTWDGTGDPDMYIRKQLTTAENSTGLRPTRVAYGSLSWDYRAEAVRLGDKAGNFASARFTPEEVAAFLMVEMLSWAEARYRSSATALSQYIGNAVYMFNAASGLSEDDPSNIKRFVSNTDGGAPMRVYRNDDHPKLVEVMVEHYSLIALTSALGIRKATVSQ